jgi:hypothetical protein
MAKADLKKVEASWREQIGQAIDYAISMSNRTQKEVWAALGHHDAAQLSRWIAGTERPQFDGLFAIEWLRQPLVIALAGLVGSGVEVQTTITLKRVPA